MMILDADHVMTRRRLADGRIIDVYPSDHGAVRLSIGTALAYHDTWEYDDPASALRACLAWGPDRSEPPDGAGRHLGAE
jgi:hypothetical protein